MADEQAADQAPPGEDAPTLTAGMLLAYQTLGPYTTLQEAAARLSRNPVGVIMDEAGQPLTVITRDTLLALLGGGKEADHARGKMGARQQARERREGVTNTAACSACARNCRPLVTAEVGTALAALAAQVREGGAVGVLGTQEGKGSGVPLEPHPLAAGPRRGAAEPASPCPRTPVAPPPRPRNKGASRLEQGASKSRRASPAMGEARLFLDSARILEGLSRSGADERAGLENGGTGGGRLLARGGAVVGLANQHIADAGAGQDITGMFGVVLDLAAHPADIEPHML